jgi:hypothetical protein
VQEQLKRFVFVAALAASCGEATPQPATPVAKQAAACDGTSIAAGGKTLCLVKTRRSFHDAAADCERMHGRLATLDDAAQAKAVATAIASPWGYGSGLWLGCTDAEKEGDWLCNGKPMSFKQWAPGQPDNALALDDCVEWLADSGTWNDASCDDKLGWICRGDATLACKTGKRVAAGSAVFCAHGEETRDYTAAKSACEKDGGKLAVIENDVEARAVFDALRLPSAIPSWTPLEGVWIGLTDEVTEGTFLWATGAPPRYTNWLPGQPDDFGKGEDCVTITLGDGRWNDADCGRSLPYLCEPK